VGNVQNCDSYSNVLSFDCYSIVFLDRSIRLSSLVYLGMGILVIQ
jgi:hypothetical protein